MNTTNTLLVIYEPDTRDQPALSRALQLIQNEGNSFSKIILVSNIYHEELGKRSVLVNDLRQGLKETCLSKQKSETHQYIENIQNHYPIDLFSIIEVQVTWHSNIIHSINEICDKHDDICFILKSTHYYSFIERRLFTPLDWHIIRKSPVPVMLIKSDRAWSYKHQLVAVDSTATDTPHKDLNKKLLTLAKDLESKLTLETHIVNAYPAMTDLVLSYGENPIIIKADIKNNHTEATLRYANRYGIKNDYVHIYNGQPENVIQDVAKKHHADLVLIGTVSREGLANFVLGNTSEKIINDVDMDVMVIHLEDKNLDEEENPSLVADQRE